MVQQLFPTVAQEEPDRMNAKQRVHAALAGRPVDRCPVTSLYSFLYQQDHFTELTGLPPWRLQEWLATTPATPLARVRRFLELGRRG